jgi:hypothetical protein
MALQQEIWVQDIQDNLYLGSEFINMSTSHDAYVTKKTVHVPQAGSAPSVSINRTSLPATIAARVDADLTYTLAEYSTDPVLITHIDELQISYDKRQSVMMNNYKLLSQIVGNNVANTWSPAGAANIIRTSGAATANTLAPGATGTRNAITLIDVAKLANKLDQDLVPTDGRVLLLPSAMFW